VACSSLEGLVRPEVDWRGVALSSVDQPLLYFKKLMF
jgi:hypothetical protein